MSAARPADAPVVSVCTVNWDTRNDLRTLLRSLRGEVRGLVEVIVVDNGSTDGSAAMVRARFPWVHLLANPNNRGYARASNQAMAAARGRYFFLLNPDARVHPGCLQRLVRFLDEHPRAAAAGPRVLNPDGSLQHSCRRFPSFTAGLFRHTPLGWLWPNNRFTRAYLMRDWNHQIAREADWLSGAAVCLRREAVEQVGPLDEGYFMFCEDVDWGYRARQAGWDLWYVPEAVVTHAIGRATDQRVFRMVLAFHRSMRRFYWKHYAARWPWALRWVPPVGIRLRALFVLKQALFTWVLSRFRHSVTATPTPHATRRPGSSEG